MVCTYYDHFRLYPFSLLFVIIVLVVFSTSLFLFTAECPSVRNVTVTITTTNGGTTWDNNTADLSAWNGLGILFLYLGSRTEDPYS